MRFSIEVFLRTHISDLGGLLGAFIMYIKVIYNRIYGFQASGDLCSVFCLLFLGRVEFPGCYS